ncbi:DUF927 domain-containing protein [Roseomonas sp. M0104]|uniref:DUF927 domain-containing protein n=1 Tax=Teichococcus coralli TaxID=2545983 RepID=A0A845BHR8_9PROT|nr:DUF927 domain-containing protein [Pseudoroseomonas coralli]MXP65630.1 DUF927 domain-containing protein [Pseudoroseomonas coralli]
MSEAAHDTTDFTGSSGSSSSNTESDAAAADLHRAAERLADLEEADFNAVEKAEAAKLGISVTALRRLRNEARQKRKKAERAEDAASAAAEKEARDAKRRAAREPAAWTRMIKRLVDLPRQECEAEIQQLAADLGLGVGELRSAVAAEKRRQRAVLERALGAAGPLPMGEVLWPPGYNMEPDGFFFTQGKDDLVRLCDPFLVEGEARNPEGEDWALCLRWEDGDGRPHRFIMPRQMTVEPGAGLETELMRRGLQVDADMTARTLLRVALSKVRTGSRITLIERSGWHGKAYALPDGGVIGAPPEPLLLRSPTAAAAVAKAGDLEGWKAEVAALAEGNDLPAFCMSVAFAAPLLQLTGDDGTGFHLSGGSKTGKTTALQSAVSAYGPPNKLGALRDWRTTANGFEAACALASDGLLVLDEIHQADPRELTGAIYAFANGGGKSRMTKNLVARERATWRLLLLSSGEVGVATMVERAGEKLPAGAALRLITLEVPNTDAWPVRHGHADRASMMIALHAGLRRHHGVAGRAFLAQLVAARQADEEALLQLLMAMQTQFAETLPAEANPQVRHAARYFALVAAAGEMAIEWEVLPWAAGEAERAVRAVMAAWLARRGGVEAGEDLEALKRLRGFISTHGASRFETIGRGGITEEVESQDPRVINRVGWREKEAGSWRYFISLDAWRTEIFAGADAQTAARALAKVGVLQREGRNIPIYKPIPGEGRVRVYAVRAGILAEGPEDA